jgi:hypothetical protein
MSSVFLRVGSSHRDSRASPGPSLAWGTGAEGARHDGVALGQRSSACFSIAACDWHCYSTPPTNVVLHTPGRYTTG